MIQIETLPNPPPTVNDRDHEDNEDPGRSHFASGNLPESPVIKSYPSRLTPKSNQYQSFRQVRYESCEIKKKHGEHVVGEKKQSRSDFKS